MCAVTLTSTWSLHFSTCSFFWSVFRAHEWIDKSGESLNFQIKMKDQPYVNRCALISRVGSLSSLVENSCTDHQCSENGVRTEQPSTFHPQSWSLYNFTLFKRTTQKKQNSTLCKSYLKMCCSQRYLSMHISAFEINYRKKTCLAGCDI